MRILFVTQWFDPEPTFKGLTFARELTRRGHQIEVLTGFPNYPGGRVYPGYRIRFLQRERIDGINIVRVPLYPSHSRSAVGRTANYCSFAAAATLIGAAAVERPDVIYAYHPPATAGIPALMLRMLYGARLVYDIQDLWPDSVAASGMMSSRAVSHLLSRLCRTIYRHADHLTVLSPGFKRALIDRGVPAEKISVVYNWCEEALVSGGQAAPDALRAEKWTDKFVVLFAGTMGVAQGLDSVLDAAQLVKATRPDVHFVFLGGGTDAVRLERKAVSTRLSNVSFLPRVSGAEMGPYLARADALLVNLKDQALFRITIPSKTQAYMAAGRPILMAVDGDAADLVRKANCGIVCEPENPERLARAVETLAAMTAGERDTLGQNGRRFYESTLSRNAGTQAFEAIFRAVCSPEHVLPSSPATSSHL